MVVVVVAADRNFVWTEPIFIVDLFKWSHLSVLLRLCSDSEWKIQIRIQILHSHHVILSWDILGNPGSLVIYR